MKKQVLTALASKIADRNRHCVLFTGAGITKDSGGTDWTGLIAYLKDELNYNNSVLTDEFDIINDMIEEYTHERVYNLVREKLRNAKLDDKLSKLSYLPWFAVFTTNYDAGLEKALKSHNKDLQVKIVFTGNEFELDGIESQLLYIKLMGSSDVPYNQRGKMILDKPDLDIAKHERVRIFQRLAEYLANKSVLFVGYSFKDRVVLDTIKMLVRTTGGIQKNTFYAVFKEDEDIDPAVKYQLEKIGVEIIFMNPKDFSEELYNEVKTQDPTDYTKKKIPLGEDIMEIKPTLIGNFLENYHPVQSHDLTDELSAYTFFKGSTDSFSPFMKNWHFKRKEMDELTEVVLERKSKSPAIIAVEGSPGCGRTIIILASIYELITKHRALAIKIRKHSIKHFPNPEEIENFISKVTERSKEKSVDPPSLLVFWAEFPLSMGDMYRFKDISERCKFPLFLIFEDIPASEIEKEIPLKDLFIKVKVEDNITVGLRDELTKYISKTLRINKFTESSDYQISEIVAEEKKFLQIMYRCIDPSKRSIDTITDEEFKKLDNPMVQKFILLCALSTVMGLEVPINILNKALTGNIDKPFGYDKILGEIIQSANAFVDYLEDETDIYFFLYHSVIADHLIHQFENSKIDDLLLDIAATADLHSKSEAEYIRLLMINNGKGKRKKLSSRIWYLDERYIPISKDNPFSLEGLKNALLEIKHRQPAIPILHYLAMLYSQGTDDDKKNSVPLLEEALQDLPEEYIHLNERKENVLTTLARTLWFQKKDQLKIKQIQDPEIQQILSYLKQARSRVLNIHPYFIHAKILNELSENKPEEERIALINEAIDLVNVGIDLSKGNTNWFENLYGLLMELLSKINLDEAETNAENLLKTNEDGLGYYTLALFFYHKTESNPTKASLYLDKAIGASKYPQAAVNLKIRILLEDKFPPHKYLLELLDKKGGTDSSTGNWRSIFNRGVIYFVNGRYTEADECFKTTRNITSWYLQKTPTLSWIEEGKPKAFSGTIQDNLTATEGFIYPHNIGGFRRGIIFWPYKQQKDILKRGGMVDFDIGFSTRGPIAENLRV